MRDVVLLLIVIGFFAAAVAFVRACAAVVGEALPPDADASTDATDATEAAA